MNYELFHYDLIVRVVKELGVKAIELAKELDLKPSAISVAIRRGERIVKDNGYAFKFQNVRKIYVF